VIQFPVQLGIELFDRIQHPGVGCFIILQKPAPLNVVTANEFALVDNTWIKFFVVGEIVLGNQLIEELPVDDFSLIVYLLFKLLHYAANQH
jgi:hypothetical protein